MHVSNYHNTQLDPHSQDRPQGITNLRETLPVLLLLVALSLPLLADDLGNVGIIQSRV